MATIALRGAGLLFVLALAACDNSDAPTNVGVPSQSRGGRQEPAAAAVNAPPAVPADVLPPANPSAGAGAASNGLGVWPAARD